MVVDKTCHLRRARLVAASQLYVDRNVARLAGSAQRWRFQSRVVSASVSEEMGVTDVLLKPLISGGLRGPIHVRMTPCFRRVTDVVFVKPPELGSVASSELYSSFTFVNTLLRRSRKGAVQ